MNVGVSLVIGAALIAAAFAVSHRYVIGAHACAANEGDCTRVWIADQWTGEVLLCQNKPPGIGTICYRAIP